MLPPHNFRSDMTYLLDFSSSHLAGNGYSCYYKRRKKSLFFALKSCKFRFIFLLVFTSKPMQKQNIFPVYFGNPCNILQTNMLRILKKDFVTAFSSTITRHNLLNCKILTIINTGNEKKVQKMMQNFTRFSH